MALLKHPRACCARPWRRCPSATTASFHPDRTMPTDTSAADWYSPRSNAVRADNDQRHCLKSRPSWSSHSMASFISACTRFARFLYKNKTIDDIKVVTVIAARSSLWEVLIVQSFLSSKFISDVSFPVESSDNKHVLYTTESLSGYRSCKKLDVLSRICILCTFVETQKSGFEKHWYWELILCLPNAKRPEACCLPGR